MALNDTELRYYDSNVLRLPADKRSEYHQQVDRLIDTLRKHLLTKANITITKIVKAGSFAKYTILRKTSADPVDVDVVFYVSGAAAVNANDPLSAHSDHFRPRGLADAEPLAAIADDRAEVCGRADAH